jgi:serine phosphatase RsbU (regulator of sigma subunit)
MGYNLNIMYISADKKYQLLLEISHKVRDTFDLDEIMNHLLDTVKTVVDYDAAGIFVLNQDLVHGRREQPKEMIAGIARRGFDPIPADHDAMLTFGKGIVGHVIFTGTSLIVPDVRLDPRYIVGRSCTLSEITVPLVRNDQTIGALDLESDQLSAYDESDLEVLGFFADAAALSIEKAMLHRQLLEKQLLDKQLQLARDVQSRLFPSEPPHISGYDIAGICLPAEEIGGDYYDYIKLSDRRLGVAVADVSGNGIASAMVMTAFRGLLRMQTRSKHEPAIFFRTINRLLPEFTGNNQFVAAVYVILEPELEFFTYVCCGQQPPLLLHPDGSMGKLDVRGPVLGILENVRYSTEKLSLAPGDILCMFTDGVVELTNQEGVCFGVERLAAAIHRGRDLPAAELVQVIIRATEQFSGSQSYIDDFTLVIIKHV